MKNTHGYHAPRGQVELRVAEYVFFKPSVVKLETERLFLRMFCEDDFEGYTKIYADAEVMRYLGE